MDKRQKHSALDDYFASMLSVPVVEELAIIQKAEPEIEFGRELQPISSETSVITSEFKIPEPDGSGSLSDLDQLLGSVVDIDLADMDLSVLDNTRVETDMTAIIASPVVGTPVVEPDASAPIEVITAIDTAVSDIEVLAVPDVDVVAEKVSEANINEVKNDDINTISVSETILDTENESAVQWQNVELEERFQALFFEVAGVTFAVPLTELGGIHQTETVNSLFGKPDWYLGIMQHREQKLSVVDTAQWVMPEQNMGEIDYKYQIQLSESNWVLGCESLHGTETLNSSDIKWRSTPGSRPWLAGMVKSRMCVLLHVTEMIKLLDNGINIHGQ